MPGPLKTFEEMSAAVEDLRNFKAEAEKKITKAEAEAKEAKEKLAEATKKLAEGGKHMAEKYPKTMRALKAASETTDEEDKKNHLAEAIDNYKSEMAAMGPETLKEQKEEHTSAEEKKKDDDEKEAMKAELTILRNEAVKPRIAVLTASYKDKVPEEKLTEYKAAWGKMTIPQLEEEISRIKPFMGKTFVTQKEPLGFSTNEIPYTAAEKKDDYIASVEKMPLTELFA